MDPLTRFHVPFEISFPIPFLSGVGKGHGLDLFPCRDDDPLHAFLADEAGFPGLNCCSNVGIEENNTLATPALSLLLRRIHNVMNEYAADLVRELRVNLFAKDGVSLATVAGENKAIFWEQLLILHKVVMLFLSDLCIANQMEEISRENGEFSMDAPSAQGLLRVFLDRTRTVLGPSSQEHQVAPLAGHFARPAHQFLIILEQRPDTWCV